MKFAKRAAYASIAAVCATLAFAPLASASGISDCVHMAKQVSSAIGSAQPGKATDDARQQADAGSSYCATSLYAQGVAHYSKAFQLLGKS